MHCPHPPAFHSELSHQLFNSARLLQLGNEKNRSDQPPHYLPLRDDFLLSSSESPSTIQNPKKKEKDSDRDSDSDISQDKKSLSLAAIKRSKTNSERGRAFRARRKKYEDDLQQMVNSLRREVADLRFLRSVRADQSLCSRASMCGSLVRLTREYFALFKHGMPSLQGVGSKRPALLTDDATTSMDGTEDSFAMKQKAFIMSAMDSELQFGGSSGREALLDQWKRYTSYHSRFHVEVVGIEVSGEQDDPIVTVDLNLHVVFSYATFENVFPHVLNNVELVNKFIGHELIYHSINRFQFSPKGQILIYESTVGLVEALIRSGASVSDVALLTQQARITEGFRLEGKDDKSNRVERLEYGNQGEITSPEGSQSRKECACAADQCNNDVTFTSKSDESGRLGADDRDVASSPMPSRLTIDFLLS